VLRGNFPRAAVGPGDSGGVAGDRAVRLAGHGERRQPGRDGFRARGERLETAIGAPRFELIPVTGIGAQRVGGLRLGAVAVRGRDFIDQSSRSDERGRGCYRRCGSSDPARCRLPKLMSSQRSRRRTFVP
jgi:hypothetical protein